MRMEKTVYLIRCDKCGSIADESSFQGVRVALWCHPAPSLEQAHTALIQDFCAKCSTLGLMAVAASKWGA